MKKINVAHIGQGPISYIGHGENIQFPTVNVEKVNFDRQISVLQNLITSAIDDYCVEKNYEITYCQINTALTNVIKSNLEFERKVYFESKQKDDQDE